MTATPPPPLMRRSASNFLLPLLCLVAVVVMWTQVRSDGIPRLDRWMRGWATKHQDPALFSVLDASKYLGSPMYALPVLLGVAALLALLRRTWWPLVVAGMSLVGLLAASVLKEIVGRSGPSGVGPPAVDGAWPSGHATTAVVCVLALAAMIAAGRPIPWPVTVLATVMLLTVGFGLVYCGHHWLSDVAVGAPLGYLVVRGAVGAADAGTDRRAPSPESIAAETPRSFVS